MIFTLEGHKAYRLRRGFTISFCASFVGKNRYNALQDPENVWRKIERGEIKKSSLTLSIMRKCFRDAQLHVGGKQIDLEDKTRAAQKADSESASKGH